MVIVCVVALIGMILQCTIPSYWGIMAGRLVNALSMGTSLSFPLARVFWRGLDVARWRYKGANADVALGIEANCVPMYMAELAPASIRGGLVNFYQSWLYVGGVLASATVYASTTHLDGKWAYMTRKCRPLPVILRVAPHPLLLTRPEHSDRRPDRTPRPPSFRCLVHPRVSPLATLRRPPPGRFGCP